jgi:hypothetical protein
MLIADKEIKVMSPVPSGQEARDLSPIILQYYYLYRYGNLQSQ